MLPGGGLEDRSLAALSLVAAHPTLDAARGVQVWTSAVLLMRSARAAALAEGLAVEYVRDAVHEAHRSSPCARRVAGWLVEVGEVHGMDVAQCGDAYAVCGVGQGLFTGTVSPPA